MPSLPFLTVGSRLSMVARVVDFHCSELIWLCTIAGAPPGFRTVFTDGSDGCIVGKVLIVPLMSGSSLEVSEGLGAPPPVSCAICDG